VFDADPASLRVLHGTGGMQPLEDDDKANIEETIDSEVLLGLEIAFRSTAVDVAPDGNTLHVQGDLTLVGVTHPLGFDVAVGPDGELTAKAVVTQSDWGMKPYSALFGALKVADDVEIEVDASDERSLAESIAAQPPRSAAIIDPGVSSFLWALLFGLYLLFGMAAIGISWGESLILAFVAAFFIFLLVRTRGIGLEDQSR
jgi:YceI-like domain